MNAANNFSFISLQDLEVYGNRLHWNMIINVPVNVLASYLVLKHSTKAMGIYKYYILATIISAFVMDFHSSVIYGFLLFMPEPLIGNISCPSGITMNLGWFWGTFVNYGILHMTMSFCGFTLFYSFIYQYFSLTKDVQIFQKPSTILGMFISILIYPIPAIAMYLWHFNFERGRIYVFNNYPSFADIFMKASCHMTLNNPIYFGYLAAAIMQIFGLYIFAVIIGIKLALVLQKVQHSLSASTLAAHKQYILALYVQGAVPLVFIVIPIFILIFMILLGVTDTQDSFQWVFQFFSLHSCGNAVAVIFIIKPYRLTMTRWARKLSGRKVIKITKVSNVTSVSIDPAK